MKVFITLGLAVLLGVAPMLLNSISLKLKYESAENVPVPLTEEEVEGAKDIPLKGALSARINSDQIAAIPLHGPDELLLFYHRDVPDPPPWC